MGEVGSAGPEAGARVRRAELVALLSLGTDLGLGQPMEHMIRACLIALRLAESAAIDDAERGVVYYSGLLAWVGCHTDAYEQAKWLGDDLAVKRDAHYGYDFGKAGPAAAFLVKHVGGAGLPLRQRVLTGVRFPGDGRRALAALTENHYLATDQLAARLGLGEQVRASLAGRGRRRRAACRGQLRAAGRRRGGRRAACGRAPGAAPARMAGLTAREVEIVRLLVRGLTAKAIAGQLVISPKTASSHIEHIYAKTGVSNRAQLSLFAMKHALMAGPNP